MATRKQLEQALANPNVRKFLDLISYTEGTQGNGYRTAFGGGKLSHLNDHPRYLKSFKQTDGKSNKTSAAGRYQFVSKTWDGVARQYGLRDFSPQNQDLGAVALLFQRGAIPALLKGDFQTAIRKTGAEWASLPSSNYKQNKRSWDNVNKFLGGKLGNVSNNYQAQQQAPTRPDMIPISQLQAAQESKRPQLTPLSQLQQPKAERPDLVPLSELQGGSEAIKRPEMTPWSEIAKEPEQPLQAAERPPMVPLAELQNQQSEQVQQNAPVLAVDETKMTGELYGSRT